MALIARLIGIVLIGTGIYFLGNNIIFTTNVYPYFWRGIAADGSILALIAGVMMLVFLPAREKSWGWIPIIIGVVLVFFSSRAILNPTSLWEFLLSFVSMAVGYKLASQGRL
ncbi:sll0442 [Synechocystis sp. PCC 6803]|uniref:Sll0442 protein n=1 Tax=Synechocystis sp. (strain ATCC 27184 / PCC 6803 / Kazusa) TaxID=1111708 RepID=P74687_SYNY3|nr:MULTISPECIES: hypothetical protein [unclassified Synechocystis]BAM53321.1 hypothetical protein BEST7613_4390 [Synechocystis sp. PCC 6803] [Bacillus subtilis BEST7613]AGF53354.1 hypothetical protein MYO_131350 [Synechocystis sp. PCC 6803]ALJ69226.1 hypothetical protein AOY38_16120 [Synechocystis sp. PCC 6803]AVP91091.1 hypothetical protein C7I86_16275 [Synechocystis sp. IPPAS B-1465]MBD2618220.1 hypothetical protein [Synechocystis sp. FACHB-898]